MSATAPLVIRGLRKSYDGVVAVDGVDVELAPGEILALVGPSGCGKSTLLRSIAGLVSIDAGSVHLAGACVDDGVNQIPPERRSTGLVFQEHALFPHLTVHDNVAFGVRDRSGKALDARVGEMLELVSLGGYGHRFPHELSGGERQRVALARALAPAPALMLFDEPFASLDHNLRVRLRRDVSAALRETGTPSVFVTHDQNEALALGDRIAVMRRGRIVQIDTPDVVFHTPVDTFVGSFMGDASFLGVDDVDGVATSAIGAVGPSAEGDLGRLSMIRPHDVRFRADPDGSAEIVALDYQGESWLATVRLTGGEQVVVWASHLDLPVVGARGEVELDRGHTQVLVTDLGDHPPV